ncbi:MAG: hypothetical protein IJG18_06450 [Kiritimatiellae bacterium]|nr:hypothetical protein [Kiritimatiellia bacterium]
MKKIEITACVFMAVFAAIACAGIAVGHDWKLALIPFTMIPALKVISLHQSPGPNPPALLSTPIVSAASEAGTSILATCVTFSLLTTLSNGVCPGAAGAMAAAIAAVSATWPFACTGKYRPLRVFSMLSASAFYVAIAIATSGNNNLTSYGAILAFPFFATIRTILAIRDWRKEAHK